MAKGFNLVGLAVMGGAVIALYEGVLIVTGMEPFIKPDPIHDFLKSLIPGPGNGGCTLQCTAPQVLNTVSCTCEDPVPGTGGTASAVPDKTIYSTGDTIVITGSGFAANESVGCRYTSMGVLVTGGAKEVVANGAGGFIVSYPFAGGGHVTCTGRTSAKVGQALVNTTAAAYARYRGF